MLKIERKKIHKNFLPTIFVIIILLTFWLTIFLFVPPESFGIPFLFALTTFFLILFSSSLLFANTRRGLFTALGVVIIMALNLFGVGNILNVSLSLGVLLAIEYYLSSKD